MKNKVFLSVLSLFALSVVTVSHAQSVPHSLSLKEYTRRVLAYYPKLKSADQGSAIALARKMQAQAGYWPSLNLSLGYTLSDDPVNVFGMLLRQERFTSSDFDLKSLNTPRRQQDIGAGLHMEVPLFDSMQTIFRVRSSREMVKAAEAEVKFTQMEARLLAQDVYLHALTLDRLRDIVEQVQRSSVDDLQKARDLKDKGMILGADYYAAKVIAGDFQRMLNEIVRQQKAMQALLNILMGEPVDSAWQKEGTITQAFKTSDDLGQWIERAIANRPDLAALSLKLNAQEKEFARQKATGLPELSVFADATNDRHKLSASGGSNYAVGMKANWALFDPGRSGRVREQGALVERQKKDLEVYRDTIKGDLVKEFANHGALVDNVEIIKGMADDAQEGVKLILPLYNEGRKSIVDLMEMRRAYLDSAQSYQKMLLGVWMAEGRLLFLSGTLTEEEADRLGEEAGL